MMIDSFDSDVIEELPPLVQILFLFGFRCDNLAGR